MQTLYTLLGLLAIVSLSNGYKLLNNGARIRRSTRSEYKMCVPQELLDLCQEMAVQDTKSETKIICIPARDRLECIEKINQHIADFGTVDPEDMYIAKNIPGQEFAIFEEIRTKEEPDADFRYEAVAVIHKNQNITNISQLKGLKSCHTGVGRNVGYKIPLTKLRKKKIIGELNEPDLSARENELKALSTLFSKACIVGNWSQDPKLDLQWKTRYSNLCELCEHPNVCNYPDKFSGYDGALRCLAHNGGEVAWTKVIFVRKFFGLSVGTTLAQPSNENPDDFAYLCPDGTNQPIQGPPCRWAARPWQAYMANADVIKSVEELRKKIENLSSVGAKNHAQWLEKVLEVKETSQPRGNNFFTLNDYLNKANYTDVIERDYGPPYKNISFCVVSDAERAKCEGLSVSAFSREVRPRFTCVQRASKDDCIYAVSEGAADIVVLDGAQTQRAHNDHRLVPILAERYASKDDSYYAVAVVPKSSNLGSFSQLRGKKSCHAGLNTIAGLEAPVYTLLNQQLIDSDSCPYTKALLGFFSTSNDNADDTAAFRCLVVNDGDVAFVNQTAVTSNTDGRNTEDWAVNLQSSDYELLCPDGRRVPVDQYEHCNLVHAPPQMVVTSPSKNEATLLEIRDALIKASDFYANSRSDLFKLFGPFSGEKDLLFRDAATGLVWISGQSEVEKEYAKVLSALAGCPK